MSYTGPGHLHSCYSTGSTTFGFTGKLAVAHTEHASLNIGVAFTEGTLCKSLRFRGFLFGLNRLGLSLWSGALNCAFLGDDVNVCVLVDTGVVDMMLHSILGGVRVSCIMPHAIWLFESLGTSYLTLAS